MPRADPLPPAGRRPWRAARPSRRARRSRASHQARAEPPADGRRRAGRRRAPQDRRGSRRARPTFPGEGACRRPPSTVSFGPMSSPLRCTARITRSPLSVTMPGDTVSPTALERGGITTSATPYLRVKSASAVWSSSYCSTSVRACPLKSRGSVRALRCGSSRSPKSTTIAIVPITSGTPTSANSK